MSISRILAVTAAGVLALSGCSAIQAAAGIQSYAVGDCINWSDADGASSTSCDAAHYGEVYHVYELELDSYDAAAINEGSETACLNEFEGYIGMSWDESEIYSATLSPSADAWSLGDRQVACILVNEDDSDLEAGTLKGAAR